MRKFKHQCLAKIGLLKFLLRLKPSASRPFPRGNNFWGFCVFALFCLGCTVSLFGQESSLTHKLPQIYTNASGAMLYDSGKIEFNKINSIFFDKTFVGYNPAVIGLDGDPLSFGDLALELSLPSESSWAFCYKGKLVASGSSLPSVGDLQSHFLRANIPNRVRSLMAFLNQNPRNFDARLGLMRELHRYANERTAKILNINLKTHDGGTSATGQRAELSPEEDFHIWQDLAEQFLYLFGTDDWLRILPDFFDAVPIENIVLHSPAMKLLFQRNIFYVEQALANRQADGGIWKMWLAMAKADGRPISVFLSQFADLPLGSGLDWPPSVISERMVEEARSTGNWQKIVDLKWPEWNDIRFALDKFAPYNMVYDIKPEELAAQRQLYWKRDIFPLLEACLNCKEHGKANEIYSDISMRPTFEREARAAANLAKSYGHEFPFAQAQGKEIADTEAEPSGNESPADVKGFANRVPTRLEELARKGYCYLLVIDQPLRVSMVTTQQGRVLDRFPAYGNVGPTNGPQRSLLQEIRSVLSQGKLPEYNIFPYIISPSHPIVKELMDKKVMPKSSARWGVLGDDAKFHPSLPDATGGSAPKYDDIVALLDSIGIKPRLTVFREFASQHPPSITAKTILLSELNRIGDSRTEYEIASSGTILDGTSDNNFWGEFVNVADTLIPKMLLRTSKADVTACFRLPFGNSRLLQQLAARHIGAIENALREMPHSEVLWTLWELFAPHANRPSQPFIETLVPVPGFPDFPIRHK